MKPESIGKNEELSRIFDDLMTRCKDAYDHFVRNNISPEDARFVLPIATQTKISITMNARELRHFFMLRCCLRAQWEIRELANTMLDMCKSVAPSLFGNAGPSCVKFGYCPEGELTCGRLKEILEIYGSK